VRAIRKRGLCILSIAGAFAAASAGAEEAAQRRFTWHPSLLMQTVADDNVLLQDGGNNGDVAFWVTPGVELDYRAPSYALGADLGLDVRSHTEQATSNETFVRATGFGEVGLLPGLTLRVSDAYVPQPERLGRPDDQTSNLLQTNRLEGDLRYWRDLSKGREIVVGLRGTRFDTDSFAALVPGAGGNPVLDTDFRADFSEGGGFLELQNAVGERSAVYLGGRARYRAFDQAPESDHAEYSFLVGLRTHRLRSFDLDIAGGYGVLDFRNRSNEPRFLGKLDLGYRARGGWHFRLGGHHRFTSNLAGKEFVDTTGRFALEKFFGTRTAATLTVFASYLEDDSQLLSSNLFGGLELAVRRQIARQLQIGLSYRYWDNRGNFSADDFSQNRLMLALSYRQ
jgi:hypothetical protein